MKKNYIAHVHLSHSEMDYSPGIEQQDPTGPPLQLLQGNLFFCSENKASLMNQLIVEGVVIDACWSGSETYGEIIARILLLLSSICAVVLNARNENVQKGACTFSD